MKAMVLAAGYGKRLGELTREIPKPMVEVRGRSIIERTLRAIAGLGITRVVVNAHHLADKLMEHVGDGSRCGVAVTWSREEVLLETGGGIREVVEWFAGEPFLVVNGDILWDLELAPLLAGFDPVDWDAWLGLVPVPEGFAGADFVRDGARRIRRAATGEAGYIYSGVMMINPESLSGFARGPFSINRMFDLAMTRGRLGGVALAGRWMDIGTPERLALARRVWDAGGD